MAQASFVTKTSATKIGKSETIEVSYEAQDGGIENFSEPRFPGWHMVSGPNVSSSTIITNGKTTSSMSYQFLLQPLSPGTLTIPGARALIDGRQYTSNAVTIQVSNKDVINSNNAASGSSLPDPLLLLPPDRPEPAHTFEPDVNDYLLKDGEDVQAKTKANIFAVADVSKKTCYPGEAIKAVYKLYSRVNMDAHITKRPSFSGFSSIDLPDESIAEYQYEKRNGRDYKAYPIRMVQLYPLQTGLQTLQPVEIESTVQYRKISGDITRDAFNNATVINYPYVIKSEPVTVNVIPFPEAGKPADFNGVTGNFTIETTTDYPDLARKEAGTLTVTINGNGNWAMVQQPVIQWPAGIDVFEPVVSEKLDSQAVPISGKRTYEFPFTASKPGTLVIPPVSIHFFNPEQKQYFTASSKPLTVVIKNTTKNLHKTTSVFNAVKAADGTEIFSSIVKVVFPVVALLLLMWFVTSYRKKRYNSRQEALLKQENELKNRRPAYKNQYADLLKVSNTPVKENYYSASAVPKKENAPIEPLIAEQTSLLNEHAGFAPLTSKQYFTLAKGRLNQLLKTHFDINEQPLYITRQSLLQHGFTASETSQVISMLELCERHIYSPFTEDFDQKQCDEMLTRITEIVSAKKTG